jgi:hypothetical protein
VGAPGRGKTKIPVIFFAHARPSAHPSPHSYIILTALSPPAREILAIHSTAPVARPSNHPAHGLGAPHARPPPLCARGARQGRNAGIINVQ